MTSVSQKELAGLLGLTTRQIGNLVDAGMPVDTPEGRHPRYPIPDAVRWYVAYKERLAGEKAAPSNIEESEARLAEANAAMAELKLAKLRGELMSVEDYKRVRYDADQRVAARLKTLATRCAPLLVGCQSEAEALTRVEPVVKEVMEELFRGEDVPDTVDEEAA